MIKNKSLNRTRSFFCILLITMSLVLLDQFTKQAAARFLKGQQPVVLIPSILKLQYLYPENRGIAFGLMQGGTIFFSILTFALIAVMIFLFFRIPADRRLIPVYSAGILLLSGAAGNLTDRIWHGYVIDFIYFYLIDFPIFNLADVFVVTGSFLMAFLLIFVYKEGDFMPGKERPE